MTATYQCPKCGYKLVVINEVKEMGVMSVGGEAHSRKIKQGRPRTRKYVFQNDVGDNPQKLMLQRKHPSGVCPQCGCILNYEKPSMIRVGYLNRNGETVWITRQDIAELLKVDE